MTPLLNIHSIVKSYDTQARKTQVLKGIDLIVEKGQKIAVMGASGSGKSTLLHLCGGLISPTAGDIEINGQLLFKMNDTQRTQFRRDHIGIIFQAFNLISTLNVRENILLPLYAANKVSQTDEKRLYELADALNITEHLPHYIDELSGGEQQRVAIARALICNPLLILADEPTGSLDSQHSETVCQLLTKSNCTQDKTLILITHEPKVALHADEIIVIKDGKIRAKLQSKNYKTVSDLALEYQTILL